MKQLFWIAFILVILIGGIVSIKLQNSDAFIASLFLAMLMGIGKFKISMEEG